MLKYALLVILSACSPMIYTHGVPNFNKVSSNVWRSGQVTSTEGWEYLYEQAAGRRVHIIKLNFANEGSDSLGEYYGFDIHYLPIQPEGDQDLWDDLKSIFIEPDTSTVSQIDNLLLNANPSDVWIVHCTHGQDRTGYIIGRYRVLHDHWNKDKAYSEMRLNHFHPELHGIHEAWESWKP